MVKRIMLLKHIFGNISHRLLVFSILIVLSSMIITPSIGVSVTKIHENITGDISGTECSGCHFASQPEHPEQYQIQQNNDPIFNSMSDSNYTAILTIGQTPYQLGPFFSGGATGWSWWDSNGFGTEKQKNLINLMILDKTTGKQVTGLTSHPTWPQASFRKYSGSYSYKADTALSPIITQTNYTDNTEIWMIKAVDLTGYSNANLTFQTWYAMETDFDYGYVAVSMNGAIWNNLPGNLTTTTNPNNNNLGNGITGNSGGWVQETMNLSSCAGKKIFLAFRFKSDGASNDEGWYVDNINVVSGITNIFNDGAETPTTLKTLSVNVSYPHLNLLNATDPLTTSATLIYNTYLQQVNVQEDISHPGTYLGYFKFDPFGEQYSGNYSVTLDTIINGSQVTANTKFQTTILGCQGCHNKKLSGVETSFLHGEGGGMQSCMFLCHGASRGFYGGSPPFMGPPKSANPMHVHEMQYGHMGGFLDGAWYTQPPYNVSSHVSTTSCIDCHTSFLHDNNGIDTANIASYILYGTNINFSSGTHGNLTCEFCHGSLAYPAIPQNQYELQGSLGKYKPSFTSHESFTDTYIINVSGSDNLTITVDGDNTEQLIELYTVGPIDNTSTVLQATSDIAQSLSSPINITIPYPYIGSWIVKLTEWQDGTINYTISSNYPIERKPIIKIPDCNSCHNSSASGAAYTADEIPDWNPGFAHSDTNNDGTLDVQCRMCHDAMHNIQVKVCQECHTNAPTNHPISDPSFTRYTVNECLECHGDPHRVAVTGGTECIACHKSPTGGNIYAAIDLASFGTHKNINTTDGNGNLTDIDCEACHYNISNMMNRSLNVSTRICTDCHIAGNFSAPIINNHKPPKVPVSVGGKISTTAYCSICHNNSINKSVYSVNASVSHYGTNESLVKTVNQTLRPRFGFMNSSDAQQYNKECNNCHNPSNSSYGNATLITVSHIGRATCNECHINGSASDLHNGSLGMPVTFNCKACHTTYASKYGAPDLTGTSMANYISCGAANCHYNETDSLNSPAMHNVDRTFAGTPGSTDTVYLDNFVSLTVTKGAIVTITSRVNDTLKFGGASRIGGAEYYIDIDPGPGKGIPMDAVDGSYDALQSTWEPVKSTIDTGILSKGNHAIYVRGMDIGKQWSAPKNATLIVQVFGYINGTVTNGTAATVSGVYVSTTGANYTTGSDGNYSLRVLVGNYTVNASKQPTHYDNTSINVVVTQSNTTILPLILQEKPTGTINGIVTIA